MLFMAKAAFCIGTVAVLAAGTGGTASLRTALDGSGRAAISALGQACEASSGCAGLGARVVSAAVGPVRDPLPTAHQPVTLSVGRPSAPAMSSHHIGRAAARAAPRG